jgi:hypothetical protein
MKIPAILLTIGLLSACSTKPLPPVWQSNAHGELQAFTSAWLSGNTRIAELEYGRARDSIASTGRADLVARAELVRCAARVATLEFDDCAGYQPLAPEAAAPERAYAAYLQGQWQALDTALLPAHHRAVVDAARSNATTNVIGMIEDPLARLIAAGVLLQRARLTPDDIAAATETASAQGWRRPLLAWLGVQLQRAQQGGDTAAAARIAKRIALVAGPKAAQ